MNGARVVHTSSGWTLAVEGLCPKLRCSRIHTSYWNGVRTWYSDGAPLVVWGTAQEAGEAYRVVHGELPEMPEHEQLELPF